MSWRSAHTAARWCCKAFFARRCELGARLAEPGEFTLRAFLNGKLDLVQAEAVADLIEAVTPLQARAAFDQLEGTLTARIREIEAALFDLVARLEASLDFPDEGYHFVERAAAAEEVDDDRSIASSPAVASRRGRLVREGAQVAIVGTPNVGKSSLFNALLNANRAIVTSIPGTTRDLLTERADIRGTLRWRWSIPQAFVIRPISSKHEGIRARVRPLESPTSRCSCRSVAPIGRRGRVAAD